jgi:hypothetical protein
VSGHFAACADRVSVAGHTARTRGVVRRPGNVGDVSDSTADTPAPHDPSAADPVNRESTATALGTVAPGTIDLGTLDLGAIERDLAAVEAALPRLDDGSYWVDEVTGEAIPDDVLAENPVARRA